MDEDVEPTAEDYMAEMNELSAKTKEILQALKDKKLSPAEAKSVLSDMVQYLGGAMEMVGTMERYGKSEEYTKT